MGIYGQPLIPISHTFVAWIFLPPFSCVNNFAFLPPELCVDFYKCKCEKEDHYNKSQTKPLGFNRPLTLWYSTGRGEERGTTYAYAGLAGVSNFAIYIFVVEMCAV